MNRGEKYPIGNSKKLINQQSDLPNNEYYDFDESTLEETEIITRMMHTIYKFHVLDLKDLDWLADFEDMGLDSLVQTAMITSIEQEFGIVFEDKVFDHFTNFSQIKNYLMRESYAT